MTASQLSADLEESLDRASQGLQLARGIRERLFAAGRFQERLWRSTLAR